MSERKIDKLEKEWTDVIPDEEGEERPDPFEQTYRDGTPKQMLAAVLARFRGKRMPL